MTLFSLKKLPDEVIEMNIFLQIVIEIFSLIKITEVSSIRKNDQLDVKMKIKLVNIIESCSADTIRMFNIIFKR